MKTLADISRATLKLLDTSPDLFVCAQTGIVRDYKAEAVRYNAKTTALVESARSGRAHAIARICQRYELESDEFYTAEQKAARILANGG